MPGPAALPHGSCSDTRVTSGQDSGLQGLGAAHTSPPCLLPCTRGGTAFWDPRGRRPWRELPQPQALCPGQVSLVPSRVGRSSVPLPDVTLPGPGGPRVRTSVTTPSPACPHLELSGPVLLRNKGSWNPAATAIQVPMWRVPVPSIQGAFPRTEASGKTHLLAASPDPLFLDRGQRNKVTSNDLPHSWLLGHLTPRAQEVTALKLLPPSRDPR